MTEVFYDKKHSFTDSSSIAAIYFDEQLNRLYVEFKSGSYAGYSGFGQSNFKDFCSAKSPGKFYNSVIRYATGFFAYAGVDLPVDGELVERRSTETIYRVSVLVEVTASSPGAALDEIINAISGRVLKSRVDVSS